MWGGVEAGVGWAPTLDRCVALVPAACSTSRVVWWLYALPAQLHVRLLLTQQPEPAALLRDTPKAAIKQAEGWAPALVGGKPVLQRLAHHKGAKCWQQHPLLSLVGRHSTHCCRRVRG